MRGFVRGLGAIGDLIWRPRNPSDERFSRARVAYMTDLLGSTVALGTGTAGVQTRYAYDPYGVAQTPVGTASTNPFQFTGRENDGTTAGLMFYRARYYNPSWGRFVSEDPIGIAGGVNLYAYVGEQPTGRTDPSGLQSAPYNAPPSGIPGGPWFWSPDPINGRGGTYRSQDDPGRTASWDDKYRHWDCDDGKGGPRQRYNWRGAPVDPDEAHSPWPFTPRWPPPMRSPIPWGPIPPGLPCLMAPSACGNPGT